MIDEKNFNKVLSDFALDRYGDTTWKVIGI
jgi:hypothetical protein